MARSDPDREDDDAPKQSDDTLDKVHAKALKRFDAATAGQMDIRAHALLCRRFISIPGAMWEGPWGDQFENSIKVEIDKLSKGVEKIIQDYRENRIVPDFRPAGGEANQDTADTLDGIHRADSYKYSAQQARDNAFEEAAAGGFGAYRLANDLADAYDPDSDEQRINPALIIVDADQRVFFDPNSKLYDKSDARFAFVLTADAREAFEEEWGKAASDWPETRLEGGYDWFTPDVVIKAEYYEKQDKAENQLIFRHRLTDEEQRYWASEIETDEIEELKTRGWALETKRRQRCRVRKYIMSGAEVLEDCGFIAGDCIPVVPVYGKRYFVENQERFRGHVSKRIDAQRIYNGRVSKLAEIDALAPREKPIFAAEQLPPNLQDLWARQEQERHPYALVNPLINPVTGEIIAAGPIGKIEPPQLQPVTAALLQIAAGDLTEETDDGADQVVANTSAEAMDIAAARVDAKSGIYLDNMRQSVKREGEIYLSMAREVYYEPGRAVETMSEDGDDGVATLHEAYTDAGGTFKVRNDFAAGKYKVIADVTEATATRRDKTVKQMLNVATVAIQAQDMEGAQAAVMTATLNMDGEGLTDFQRWQRRRAIGLGLVEPNEEEQAEMAKANEEAANAPPDPATILADAQAQALKGSAMKDAAQAQKTIADSVIAKLKPIIDGFKAETDRLKVFMGKDAPVPADMSEQMRPLIDQAIREAMDSPDPLPGADQLPRMRIRRGSEMPANDEDIAA